MIKNQEHTPLMQQYHAIKTGYPDTLLFFQVGDFYELFFDDAKQAASFLGIALTARGKNKGDPIPLCGVPLHAIDHYLCKLVKGGFKVALCNQLEDPKPGVIVKRGVRQVLTPGTLTDAKLLDDRSASYLFSFYPTADSWGLVFSELLTAQIFITTVPANAEKLLESELIRFFPDEIIMPNCSNVKEYQSYFKRLGYFTTVVHQDADETNDQKEQASSWSKKQFSKIAQETIDNNEAMKQALYYFYAYMSKNQRDCLDQFATIFFYKPDDFLILDSATQRNLELVKNIQDGSSKNTLFELMDDAKTAMGSRMIKKWLLRPLVKKEAIIQRQDIVGLLCADISLIAALGDILMRMGDFERIVGRIALQRAALADYVALVQALNAIPCIANLLKPKKDFPLIRVIIEHLGQFEQLSALLESSLHEEPSDECMIKQGYDERLDQMRILVNNSNDRVNELERIEQKSTGIQSLKIRYNAIQGYYIEVTNANLAVVPERYRCLQTLVGRERFTIPELQQLQYEIEAARKDIKNHENALFDSIKQHIAHYNSLLRKSAHAVAHIDALLAFARLAYENGYVRPEFNENRSLIITAGRHPVVENSLSHAFIPNDTRLTDEQSLWIITGPNMGGKSTYLRQVAQIAIMAHVGSFVPASKANLPLLDRIFTRLGASDNVAEGKSTFLVEMEETAMICTQATEKSLVILDEVGRGTSTFDGLAIAQAVVEHIFTQIGARCLFATHYHELTRLQENYPGIVAYYAASKKTERGIIFLYKMVQGVADGSFGIEVAKLAHLPTQIIARSTMLVDFFSNETVSSVTKVTSEQAEIDRENAALKAENKRLLSENSKAQKILAVMNDIDFDTLSPKKAFDLLWLCKDI